MIVAESRFDVVLDTDVPFVVERLGWHKILPLAAALSERTELRSRRLREQFDAVLISNTAREHRYHAQAADLIERFRAADIDVIPYKGPFWGARIYPDYSWRHIGDIDLLMTNAEARRASEILRSDGFHPDVVGASEEDDFARRGELTYFPAKGSGSLVPVQLHWELVPAPRFLVRRFLRYQDLAGSERIATWRSISYLVPAPEIELLYLTLHATCQHQFMRFVHIMDMVYFLRRHGDLDWDRVFDLGQSRGCTVPLYYALTFLGEFTDLPVPARRRLAKLSPLPWTRLAAGLLRPRSVLYTTERRGRRVRKLFRAAMSW